MKLHLLLLLIPFAHAFGNRRLSGHICAHQVYILAQGAPTEKPGKTFSADREKWYDAKIDDSGVGTALLASLPECQKANAISIKVTDDSRLFEAVAYINARCVAAECLVMTKFAGVHGARFRVES